VTPGKGRFLYWDGIWVADLTFLVFLVFEECYYWIWTKPLPIAILKDFQNWSYTKVVNEEKKSEGKNMLKYITNLNRIFHNYCFRAFRNNIFSCFLSNKKYPAFCTCFMVGKLETHLISVGIRNTACGTALMSFFFFFFSNFLDYLQCLWSKAYSDTEEPCKRAKLIFSPELCKTV